ncbi:MAG: hypothetical protein WBD99_11720 [Thermodesulfobacteriota bacterium]
MKRIFLYDLSLILVIGFVASFPNPALTEQKNMQAKKGNIVCLKVNQKGKIIVIEEYTECNGLLVFIGNDGQVYSVHGPIEELQKIAKNPKRRMGYPTTLKVRGTVEGHKKAWHLYLSSLSAEDSQKSEERTIEGTIVCVIPDFSKGSARPVVASGSCNELEPHAHVLYSKEGEIYALQGSEEKIINIEKSAKRRNVFIRGRILGNQKGWILFVD